MYKELEVKQEKYVGFPMKMNAYAHEGLFVVQKDENAFILYFLLGVMTQNYWTWGRMETTIITLSKQFPIKTKESDNRNEIRRLLLVLHDRGWMKITFDEKSLKYDTLITITMVDLDSPRVMDVVLSDNYKHTGWLMVTQEMFDACKGNARHFRAMIYAEWRMFRGQDNEGKYRISLDEWEKTMDISHATAVKLVKELDELNLVNKQRGVMYQDANGQPKRETNLYSVVSEEERQEREAEAKEGQYSFEHQHNIDVQAAAAQWDEVDPRCEGTNVYKTDKKDYLGSKEYWIWKTTKYENTRKHLDGRFMKFKKARPDLYANVEREGKKYMKEKEAHQSRQTSEVQMYDSSSTYHDESFVDYDKLSAKRLEIEAKQKAQDRLNELLDSPYTNTEDEEILCPF